MVFSHFLWSSLLIFEASNLSNISSSSSVTAVRDIIPDFESENVSCRSRNFETTNSTIDFASRWDFDRGICIPRMVLSIRIGSNEIGKSTPAYIFHERFNSFTKIRCSAWLKGGSSGGLSLSLRSCGSRKWFSVLRCSRFQSSYYWMI